MPLSLSRAAARRFLPSVTILGLIGFAAAGCASGPLADFTGSSNGAFGERVIARVALVCMTLDSDDDLGVLPQPLRLRGKRRPCRRRQDGAVPAEMDDGASGPGDEIGAQGVDPDQGRRRRAARDDGRQAKLSRSRGGEADCGQEKDCAAHQSSRLDQSGSDAA